MIRAIHRDVLEQIKGGSDNVFDSIVTNPPAGVSFIGKGSDKGGRRCPSPSNAPPIFTVIRHSSRIPFNSLSAGFR